MPDLPRPEDAAPHPIIRRLIGWLQSEVGGWTIVGLLAIVALSVAAFGLIAPQQPPPALNPFEPVPPAAPAELVDLTVAPNRLQPLSSERARVWNAALPFSTAPNPPAKPFVAPSADLQSYGRALDCLTAALYYEAGAQTVEGQAAVAQVVLNRVRHPAYPRTVCAVVFQGSERASGCQFTFTCDGSLSRPPSPTGWARARAVATAALNGRVMASVGAATHYHADWVAPVWAARLAKVVQVQGHIFYRWPGAWGLPQAFSSLYRGGEPEVARMAILSTSLPDEPTSVEPVVIMASAQVSSEAGLVASPGEDSVPILLRAEVSDAPPEPSPPSQGENRPPPLARREVAIAADPLINPGEGPPAAQQPRRRIPAPSSW